MKIKYSEYQSEEMTNVLDNILDYRDELCVNTMLKGCQNGYIADDAARRKGQLFVKGGCCISNTYNSAGVVWMAFLIRNYRYYDRSDTICFNIKRYGRPDE